VENKASFETSVPIQGSYSSDNATLQIKEEQLDIVKKWMQTGDVKIYKESYTQQKSFTVPVKREELVIEKKDPAFADPENIATPTEVTRILLGEEQVEFTKHWVDLEDVSVYKHQIEDIKHIEVTLRHEVPNIKFTELFSDSGQEL